MENKIKIVFATGNPHKLQEVNEIVQGSGIEFILPPDSFNPLENGETFEEKMSRLTSELSDMFVKSHELEEEIRRKLGAIGYEI